MNNRKLIYVTNIPTPYRNKRFNLMQEIFPPKGIDFEVLYMSRNEPNRNWKVDYNEIKYPYRIFKGIHPTIGNMYAHFNPGLLYAIMREDYDIVVIGGIASPSHILAPFFLNRKALKILSVESNLDSVNITSGIGAKVKKKIISMYDAYQVTGKRSIDYLKYFQPNLKNQIIRLPNIIDEDKYNRSVNVLKSRRSQIRRKYNIRDSEQMWLCPARLEEFKGLHLLLPLLKSIDNVSLLIVGEGSQKEQLQSMIDKYNLPVRLLGFKQEEEMLSLYASSDLFVLPSLSDPSPLSPIEAIASGLPILVSSRIGNCNDVCKSKNGWIIDIKSDEAKNKALINSIAKLDNNSLYQKGLFSKEIFKKNFDSIKSLNNYADSILGLLNT